MKRNHLLLALLLFQVIQLFGQYPIGHKTLTFNDPARANRAIQTELYYPAQLSGDDQPLAAGQFPAVVFGHGFVMSVNAYANVWEALVPQGFIVCLPVTEGGFAPSHDNFAKDLAFLVTALQDAGAVSGGFWEGHISGKFALMGHSMGGGSALLGAPLNPAITATAVFAPAETTPSAITACAQIESPVLIFTGSQDCVVPTANHGAPMYDALGSDCKTHVDLTGGNHCYFGNFNFNCNLGESTTGCQPGITREQQHALVTGLLLPWLNAQLKADTVQWASFQSGLVSTPGIQSAQNCGLSTAAGLPATQPGWVISPNPVERELFIHLDQAPSGSVQFAAADSSGRIFNFSSQAVNLGPTDWRLDVSALPAGAYRLLLTNAAGSLSAAFLKK